MHNNRSLARELSLISLGLINDKSHHKFKKFQTVVVIGMGGSILGSEALYFFLKDWVGKIKSSSSCRSNDKRIP